MSSFKWEFACCEYWNELLREYVDNVFCVLSRSVKCDLKNAIQVYSLQKLFETIHSRDHAWSSHRQFFSWSSNLTFWRMTHVHSRLSSDVYDETSLMKHLIKLDENDSSNLTNATQQTWWMKTSSHQMTKATHQTWWVKTSFYQTTKAIHQTWQKQRHFIKSNQRVISSNFSKRQTIFLLSDEQSSAVILDMKNLILQRVVFWMKINVCVKLLW